MRELWRRLEAWLSTNAPQVLETLQPGATEEQIERAEAFLSVKLPEDFKASYRIHNGQTPYESGLLDGRELLSLERIQDEWKVWKDVLDSGDLDGFRSEPNGPIRDDWWNEKWIPITHDGSGNHDCLDLNPATGGQAGQIIDFWHDDPTRALMADSYGSWLKALVEGCESGRYVFSDECGGVVEADDV